MNFTLGFGAASVTGPGLTLDRHRQRAGEPRTRRSQSRRAVVVGFAANPLDAAGPSCWMQRDGTGARRAWRGEGQGRWFWPALYDCCRPRVPDQQGSPAAATELPQSSGGSTAADQAVLVFVWRLKESRPMGPGRANPLLASSTAINGPFGRHRLGDCAMLSPAPAAAGRCAKLVRALMGERTRSASILIKNPSASSRPHAARLRPALVRHCRQRCLLELPNYQIQAPRYERTRTADRLPAERRFRYSTRLRCEALWRALGRNMSRILRIFDGAPTSERSKSAGVGLASMSSSTG